MFKTKKFVRGLSTASGILLLILFSCLVLTNVANASIYLKFDGIDGDVTTEGHEKWIELSSFNLGASATNPTAGGSGGVAGKVKFSDLTITKPVDTSSPKLFEALNTGKHFNDVVLDVTKSTADKSLTFLEYKFNDVLITSYDVSGTSNSTPTENLSLNFTKIEMIFNQFDDRGGLVQTITSGVNSDIPSAPIPASCVFLASGLVGLIFLKKKI